MTPRTFDWGVNYDERSKDFPIRAVIRKAVKRKNRLWQVGPILDQGSEGACVGFGWTAEGLASPVRVNLSRLKVRAPKEPNKFAQYVYAFAKTIDEYDGVDYEGTSVLAGAKSMQTFGLLKEYRWAFSMNEVIDSIISKGPVVLGIPWYDGMYEAPGGVLKVSGENIGGHCILAVGYRVASPLAGGKDTVILQNSWGTEWGINGLAEIEVSELAKLVAEGEACLPIKRAFGIF
jgi:hypothetical protein